MVSHDDDDTKVTSDEQEEESSEVEPSHDDQDDGDEQQAGNQSEIITQPTRKRRGNKAFNDSVAAIIIQALKPTRGGIKKRSSSANSSQGRNKQRRYPSRRGKAPVGYVKNPQLKDYDIDEVRFYRQQPYESKVMISNLESEIKTINTDNTPMRFKILMADMDVKAKAIALQKLEALNSMDPSSGEYHKLSQWVNAVCRIPFGVYKPLPVTASSPKNDIRNFLTKTRDRLDTQVYGHRDAKDHLIRLLAQWISNPLAKGLILGIQGSMGVGKTCLVKEGVCKALDIPFAFVPLGGISDGSHLEGFSYTYEGATWGKVVDLLMRAGCMNPVVFFDEVDKVSQTQKGEEIINILIHMTDVTQNDKFHDKYFTDFSFDLSRSIMIFTYNDEEAINPILRDRMVKIRTQGYTTSDKLQIAKKHMLPEMFREFNMPEKGAIEFSDAILRLVIDQCEPEEGVRNFKRALHDVISNLHYESLVSLDDVPKDEHITVTPEMVHKYVNKPVKDSKHILHHMYL